MRHRPKGGKKSRCHLIKELGQKVSKRRKGIPHQETEGGMIPKEKKSHSHEVRNAGVCYKPEQESSMCASSLNTTIKKKTEARKSNPFGGHGTDHGERERG